MTWEVRVFRCSTIGQGASWLLYYERIAGEALPSVRLAFSPENTPISDDGGLGL